ncbi:MAG: HAD-IA family hydrolase [bacterium]|nr:HAD-IA family hydrolase [bacterium]
MANSFFIKTIIFDIGGVIVNSFGKELIDYTSGKLGIEQSRIRELMNRYEPSLQKGLISPTEFWKKIINENGSNVPSDNVLESLWIEPYVENVHIDEHMINLVKTLKNNYIVGCISNSIVPHTLYNKERELYSLFNPCLLSDEVHIRKPDKEIFELYLKMTKCEPHEAIFIDDEAPLLVNAQKMGMNTVVFQNIDQLKKELAIFKINIEESQNSNIAQHLI